MCQDLLLSRYGVAYYNLIQEYFEDVAELYEHAIHEISNERIRQRWLHGWQFEMSFDEFKNKLGIGTENVESDENVDDILSRIKNDFG